MSGRVDKSNQRCLRHVRRGGGSLRVTCNCPAGDETPSTYLSGIPGELPSKLAEVGGTPKQYIKEPLTEPRNWSLTFYFVLSREHKGKITTTPPPPTQQHTHTLTHTFLKMASLTGQPFPEDVTFFHIPYVADKAGANEVCGMPVPYKASEGTFLALSPSLSLLYTHTVPTHHKTDMGMALYV